MGDDHVGVFHTGKERTWHFEAFKEGVLAGESARTAGFSSERDARIAGELFLRCYIVRKR